MGLFKEIYCAQCNKKTSLLTRKKLGDDHYICSACTTTVPGYIHNCLDAYDLTQFKELLQYIDYSNNELRKIFKENHSFYSLHIDTEHRLFYFDSGLFSTPIYFKFTDLADFDLVFSAEEFKEGVLGDKVSGKILLKIKMDKPYFYFEKIIAKDIKAKAKKTFFGSKVEYENPKGMDDFLLYFMSAWQDDVASNSSNYHDNPAQDHPSASSELQQAMALFMIDDLSDITLSQIKEQRNRLIKAYHPDTGSEADTQFAQKINAAYEILKKYAS